MKFIRVHLDGPIQAVIRINVAHIVSYYDRAGHGSALIETTSPPDDDKGTMSSPINRVACTAAAIDDAIQMLADSTLTFANVGIPAREEGR